MVQRHFRAICIDFSLFIYVLGNCRCAALLLFFFFLIQIHSIIQQRCCQAIRFKCNSHSNISFGKQRSRLLGALFEDFKLHITIDWCMVYSCSCSYSCPYPFYFYLTFSILYSRLFALAPQHSVQFLLIHFNLN